MGFMFCACPDTVFWTELALSHGTAHYLKDLHLASFLAFADYVLFRMQLAVLARTTILDQNEKMSWLVRRQSVNPGGSMLSVADL